MTISRVQLISTIGHLNSLGATLPDHVEQGVHDVLRLTEEVAQLDTLRHGIATAVVDALMRRADPTEDPAVQRAVIAAAVVEHRPGIEQVIDDRMVNVIAEHRDVMLEALRRPFDDAAEVLLECLEPLDGCDLSVERTILRRGPDATAAWIAVQNAEHTIDRTRKAWNTLHPGGSAGKTHGALVISDPEPGVYLADPERQQLSPFDIARRGWPLTLATFDEFDRRVAAVNAEAAGLRPADPDDAFAANFRRQHGFEPMTSPPAA